MKKSIHKLYFFFLLFLLPYTTKGINDTLQKDDGLWKIVKMRADSIILTHMGQAFIDSSVVWDEGGSNCYVGKRLAYDSWETKTNKTIELYVVEYTRKSFALDGISEKIVLAFDKNGNLTNHKKISWSIEGIQDCSVYGYPSKFAVNKDEAESIAIQNGFTKPDAYLYWRKTSNPNDSFYLGEFKIGVHEKKLTYAKGQYEYDVSNHMKIDPWNGAILESWTDTSSVKVPMEVKFFGGYVPSVLIPDGEWAFAPGLLASWKQNIGIDLTAKKYQCIGRMMDPFDPYKNRSYILMGSEFWYNGTFQVAPKVGVGYYYWWIFNTNVNMILYSDFKSVYPAVVPEIGLSIMNRLEINYGYTINLNNKQTNIYQTHRIALRMNFLSRDE